jgi:hypothetical protein
LLQFDHFDFFFPKYPHHIYILKKKPKNKEEEICWGGRTTTYGVVWPPYLDFFLKKIKYVMGAFWKKKGQSDQIATI